MRPQSDQAYVSEAEAASLLPDKQTFLDDLYDYGTSRTDAPSIYHVMTGLAAISAVCSSNVWIRGLAGNDVPYHFFGMISGAAQDARKSTSIRYLRALLDDVVPGRIAQDAGSEAGLLAMMVEGQEAVGGGVVLSRGAVVQEEMGQFLKKICMDQHGQGLKVRLLQMADGDMISHKLKKDTIRIQNPRVTWLGGVNPALITENTTLEDWQGGLMARFVCILAQREREYIRTADDQDLWRSALGKLQDIHASKYGHCAGLSKQAQPIWDEWVTSILHEAKNSGDLAHIAALGRASVHAAKAAALFCINDGRATVEPWTLGPKQVMRGCALADMHIRSFCALADMAVADNGMRDRATVLRVVRSMGAGWLKRGRVLTESKMLLKRFMEVMDTLTEEGRLESKPVGNDIVIRLRDPDAEEAAEEKKLRLSAGGSNLVSLR